MSELIASPKIQERVREEVQAVIATRTRDEWVAVFAGADCCAEPVLEVDEVVRHPLHEARGVFSRAPGPGASEVLQIRTPVAAARADRTAPRLGEHSAQVLAEYGFAADEIAPLVGE
jgi:alpha-methylacyl-CoA racemase